MPDISMCLNHGCKLRKDCHRYQAKPSRRQSYSKWQVKGGKCDGYWPMKKVEEKSCNELDYLAGC